MIEPSQNEITAILAAGEAAGAHLDKVGKTDLATLSYDEWMSFIELTISAFQDEMARLHAPHAVTRSADDPIQSGDHMPIQAHEVPY